MPTYRQCSTASKARGRVGWLPAILLEHHLDQARRAMMQGKRDHAMRSLQRFDILADLLIRDPTAHTVLRTDTAALITTLRGT